MSGRAIGARGDGFFVAAASTAALLAFGGFAGTYWLQLPAGTFTGSGLLHLHGLLFSAWTLLFLGQTVLVARRDVALHRAWGVVGVSLATAMVIVGMAVALQWVRKADAQGWGDGARLGLFGSVTSLALFAGFLVAALVCVRRPDWHKRLMLLATVNLLGAALARALFSLGGGGGPGVRLGDMPAPATTSLAVEFTGEAAGFVLIAAGMIHDWRTRGRPHAAYLVGAAVLATACVLRAVVGPTAAWRAAADALLALAG